MSTVAAAAKRLTGAGICHAIQVIGGNARLAAFSATDEAGEAALRRLYPRPMTGDAAAAELRAGRSVVIADSETDERFDPMLRAEIIGGTMSAESEGAGKGCTFRFHITAETVAAPVSAKAAAMTTIDPQMAASHPLRILLAEDNLVNQKLARRLLSQMGYTADVVGNGQLAVQAAERQPYDVVPMDVQMPEMDGLEASRRILAPRCPDAARRPRIVAMTANTIQGDREECLAAGMDDYVTKPIRVEALVEALMNATARKSA